MILGVFHLKIFPENFLIFPKFMENTSTLMAKTNLSDGNSDFPMEKIIFSMIFSRLLTIFIITLSEGFQHFFEKWKAKITHNIQLLLKAGLHRIIHPNEYFLKFWLVSSLMRWDESDEGQRVPTDDEGDWGARCWWWSSTSADQRRSWITVGFVFRLLQRVDTG